MSELLRFEEIARSMRWGFLSDNIVNIIDKHGNGSNKLKKNEKKIVKGAIEFFEMVECGIDSVGKSDFSGEIEKIVECLIVYNYTSNVLMSVENEYEDFSKDIVKKKVEELSAICRKLYNDEKQNEKEIEALREFFLFLGKFTFKETNDILENQPKTEITSWGSINSLKSVLQKI